MFSRASSAREQAHDKTADIVTVKAVPSIVSADLKIEGNLNSTGEIQVDGVVKGDIKCKALIVGVKGSVTGEVLAQTVRMHGAIKPTPESDLVAAAAQGNRGVAHKMRGAQRIPDIAHALFEQVLDG